MYCVFIELLIISLFLDKLSLYNESVSCVNAVKSLSQLGEGLYVVILKLVSSGRIFLVKLSNSVIETVE